jgi:hypothetical protein
MERCFKNKSGTEVVRKFCEKKVCEKICAGGKRKREGGERG